MAGLLRTGTNVIAAHLKQDRYEAGLLAEIDLLFADGSSRKIVTDRTWGFFPALEDENGDQDEDYGLVILKTVVENGEEFLSTPDTDEELQEVYDLFMERIFEDADPEDSE